MKTCLNFSLSLWPYLFFRDFDSVSLFLSISSLAQSLIACLPEYFTLLLFLFFFLPFQSAKDSHCWRYIHSYVCICMYMYCMYAVETVWLFAVLLVCFKQMSPFGRSVLDALFQITFFFSNHDKRVGRRWLIGLIHLNSLLHLGQLVVHCEEARGSCGCLIPTFTLLLSFSP